MPSKSVHKMTFHTEPADNSFHIEYCDILLIVVLVGLFSFIFLGVYKQKSSEETKLHEESIICIKEFDSAGCNPFNMSHTCQEKLECIKHGDGLGFMDILDILNKHIKNNGAIPILMIFLAIGIELRHRMNNT